MQRAALAILLTLAAGMPAALADGRNGDVYADGRGFAGEALDRLLSRDEGADVTDGEASDEGPIDCMLRLPAPGAAGSVPA